MKWAIRSQVLQSQMGIIYCLTSPSGKRYIGQTRQTLNKRIRQHKSRDGSCILLENAINKYGIDSFIIETLLELDNHELDYFETLLINLYNTQEPNGYNIRAGGGCSTFSAESCERMRQSKLGAKNHNYGKPRSNECKKAISDAKSGEKHHFYGKSFTYEHKIALSKSHKSDELPMYMVSVKERPKMYQSAGYAIVNHSKLPNKYFTSKLLSIEDKYKLALEYLQSCEMDAVQRLNVNGF